MAAKPVILVADDEASFRQPLCDNLEMEGYRVVSAVDGPSAVAAALAEPPDLLLLDIMMPKLSGFDVCRALRAKGLAVPIVILSARDQEVDVVLGLELGADDYVTKPFGLAELLARIKAVLRRQAKLQVQAQATNRRLRIGEAEVDLSRFEATRRGKPLALTPREFAILAHFVAKRGLVVSRDELLNEIWGYDQFPTTRTVDNHMVRIRKLIELHPERPELLVSIRGVGYRLLDEAFAKA